MNARTIAVYRVVLVIVGLLASGSPSSAQTSNEYRLKAVFLYNFAHFVEWPETSFRANGPLVIAVVGENHFGTALEETIKGEVVKGRSIQIQYYKDVTELKPCHILFVSRSQRDNLKQILNKVDKHTLTVSDELKFNDAGGMIRFYKEQNKIRLSINKNALDSTRLIVSSKLLRLSDIKD